MPNWSEIEQAISQSTGSPFKISAKRAVGGGCINEAFHVQDQNQEYFVKLNSAHQLDMFLAEYDGLHELAKSGTVRVPAPVCAGTSGRSSFLVLEFIELGASSNSVALGQQLAAMHRTTQDQFGWFRDNTIGATLQINRYCDDWSEFWRLHRLGFQIELAGNKGIGRRTVDKADQLMGRLDALFEDYQPAASLLHGDLWGGNCATDRDHNPVLYDPAVYFGDRETDLAMTELFGGFGASFMAAYQDAYPIDPGYRTRKTLYNLYHILNHFNLFGGGYASQAETMMDQLLCELR